MLTTLPAVGEKSTLKKKPKPNARANSFDPSKVAPKSDYRPLPTRPPTWAKLEATGTATYSRIRKEMMTHHRTEGERAYIGAPDLENLITACRLADQIDLADEIIETQRQMGEIKPSALTAKAAVIKDYQRALAGLGYCYGANTSYIDLDAVDEDEDDFG